MNIVLASQSPRRQQLLAEAGYQFTVLTPDDEVERTVSNKLNPAAFVQASALKKAQFVAGQIAADVPPNTVLLAADTVALCNGEVLGKPKSRSDAERMLTMMSGRQHQVLTGVCLWYLPTKMHKTWVETTVLRMDTLESEPLQKYLDSGDWQGKAGAFGYQDGLDWVHIEQGLASNVVGLPVERLSDWLTEIC